MTSEDSHDPNFCKAECIKPLPLLQTLFLLEFRVLSVLMGAILLWVGIQHKKFLHGDINVIARAFEYITHVICALITGNEYLINYYKAYVFEDQKIFKEVHKILKKYTLSIHILHLMLYLLFLYTNADNAGQPWLDFFFLNLFRMGTEFGRMPITMILLLLYYRTKLLSAKIREEASQFTSTFQWKKFGNLYIKHIEALENTDWPVKFMIFVQLIVGFVKVCTIQLNMALFYKNNPASFVTTIHLMERIILLMYIYASLFLPSIIMELTLKEMDTLKTQLADDMITCTDEQRKTQLCKMLNCFRSYPLTYTIWRSLEINANFCVRFFSLSTTCLICLLQFYHLLEN